MRKIGCRIAGVWVDALTMQETLDRSALLIRTEGVSQHAVVNAAKIVAAQTDTFLANSLAHSDIVNADGMSVVWASRLLPGKSIGARVAGIDYMERLCERATLEGWSVFLLGAEQDTLKQVEAVLRTRHSNLHIAGTRNGFWTSDEEENVIEMINSTEPDILFLAFPTPAKEHFVERNRALLRVRLIVGVGGSFDVIAGKTRRAPMWMQRTGLEWLFRLIQEPRRMWRRYLVGNSTFIWLVIREVCTRRPLP